MSLINAKFSKTLLTAVVACLAMLLPVAASASGTADLYMNGAPETIQVGQNFTLDFTITPGNGAIISEVSVGIPYSNSSYFQLVNISNAGSAFDQTVKESIVGGCLILDRKSSSGVSAGPAEIANVTIQANTPGLFNFDLQKIGFGGTCEQYDWGITTQNYVVGGVPGSYFNLDVTAANPPSSTSPSASPTPLSIAQAGSNGSSPQPSASPASGKANGDAKVMAGSNTAAVKPAGVSKITNSVKPALLQAVGVKNASSSSFYVLEIALIPLFGALAVGVLFTNKKLIARLTVRRSKNRSIVSGNSNPKT